MRKRKEGWESLFDKLESQGTLDRLKKIREDYKRKAAEEQAEWNRKVKEGKHD